MGLVKQASKATVVDITMVLANFMVNLFMLLQQQCRENIRN